MFRTNQSRANALRVQDRGITVALTRRLHRFFVAQARRVAARYLAEFPDLNATVTQPPSAEELLPESERQMLWAAVSPFIIQATMTAADSAGQLVGLPTYDELDPRVQRLLKDAHLHIGEVHDTTLTAIRGVLAGGFANALTVGEMLAAILTTVAEVYGNRTLTIARTEIANARQLATLQRYQDAGISMVYVSDGDDCGWTEHDDPDIANGSVRHIGDAVEYSLAHTNCSRTCLPIR